MLSSWLEFKMINSSILYRFFVFLILTAIAVQIDFNSLILVGEDDQIEIENSRRFRMVRAQGGHADTLVVEGNYLPINNSILDTILSTENVTNICIKSAPNSIIENMDINFSISLVNSPNSIIRSNNITNILPNSVKAAIYINSSDNVSIVGNTISNIEMTNSLLVEHSRSIRLKNNVLINNSVTSAIVVKRALNTTILNNSLFNTISKQADVATAIIIEHSMNTQINHNVIHNLSFIGIHAASEGISLRYSENTTIKSNRIANLRDTHHGSFAINVISCKNIYILNNNVSNTITWLFIEENPQSENIYCRGNYWNGHLQECETTSTTELSQKTSFVSLYGTILGLVAICFIRIKSYRREC